MKFKGTFVATLFLIGMLFSVAHADVKYTIVTKFSFTKSSTESSTEADQTIDTKIYFVKSNKTRREDITDYAIAPSKEVFILRCDLKKQFRIDDALKIYTVSDWAPSGFNSPASESELREDIPEMKTVIHYSIQKLAPEKMNGFDTECYQVTETDKYSGDSGNRESTNKMKIWVANVQGWQPCDQEKIALPASFTHVVTFPEGRRRFIEEYTGDVDIMNKISNELSVRTESIIDSGENASNDSTADQNLILYSPNEKFDNSLFEIPAGYREVTSEEYKKLRSEAEVKAIRESKKLKQ